jgi:hypothetical protein
MKIKSAANPRYNQHGSIDVEIEHEIHGWIPFTASTEDPAEHGRKLYADLLEGKYGAVTPYEVGDKS